MEVKTIYYQPSTEKEFPINKIDPLIIFVIIIFSSVNVHLDLLLLTTQWYVILNVLGNTKIFTASPSNHYKWIFIFECCGF